MWVQNPKIIEGNNFLVMDSSKFIHPAIVVNGIFINRVTKTKIKHIVRVWEK